MLRPAGCPSQAACHRLLTVSVFPYRVLQRLVYGLLELLILQGPPKLWRHFDGSFCQILCGPDIDLSLGGIDRY
jgi:hypothetical protein